MLVIEILLCHYTQTHNRITKYIGMTYDMTWDCAKTKVSTKGLKPLTTI